MTYRPLIDLLHTLYTPYILLTYLYIPLIYHVYTPYVPLIYHLHTPYKPLTYPCTKGPCSYTLRFMAEAYADFNVGCHALGPQKMLFRV